MKYRSFSVLLHIVDKTHCIKIPFSDAVYIVLRHFSRKVDIVVLRNNLFVMPVHKETHIYISVRINAIKTMLVICKPYVASLSLCKALTYDNIKKHLLHYASPKIHTRA